MDDRPMPLSLPEPLDVGPDFWDDPDLIAAAEAGRLDLFLLAYRGAKRARLPQDAVARLLGRSQSTVHRLETGKTHPPDAVLYSMLTRLEVPPAVTARWATHERGTNSPRDVIERNRS
jgi:hypothetical protein